MLKVHRELTGLNASKADAGDANSFLRNVLVEVATENYRQLMFETLAFAKSNSDSDLYLDPPLRANERVISGLFSNAISRVAPRSRPEARIDRSELQLTSEALGSDFGSEAPTSRAGRVDYLAWYGQRIIAVELKAASMNCAVPLLTKSVQHRWATVVDQAKSAQNHLLSLKDEDPVRYPKPVSLALMVVVGRRTTTLDTVHEYDDHVEELAAEFIKILGQLDPVSNFRATYTFPKECRALAPRKRGQAIPHDDKVIYTPFVAFLAKQAVNTTS